MNDTKIEPWTEADTDRAEQDVDAYGAIMSPEGYRIIAEVKRQAAEIERLKGELAKAKDERDEVVATQALRIEGLEQANREAHQAIAKRNAEIERLAAELAGQSKATLDWREAAKRHMARAETAEKLALRMADAADLERELADLRRTVNEGIEITHDQAIKIDTQKAEIERLTAALRHAVDIAKDIGAQRDRAFDAANRATDLRPGLTEEEARETAGPLSRDIYNRIGLTTGNKIGAPEWMRDAIAAALLRASRGAPSPGDVSVPRAILERLAKAADPTFSDAREARWAAERILQRAPLAAEPARTDPLYARVLAEATQTDANRGGQ